MVLQSNFSISEFYTVCIYENVPGNNDITPFADNGNSKRRKLEAQERKRSGTEPFSQIGLANIEAI